MQLADGGAPGVQLREFDGADQSRTSSRNPTTSKWQDIQVLWGASAGRAKFSKRAD